MNEVEWTPKRVEIELQEAADAMRKLPRPHVAGYFNSWPVVVRNHWDAYGRDRDAPARGHATPREATRMESVMLWLRRLRRDEQNIL